MTNSDRGKNKKSFDVYGRMGTHIYKQNDNIGWNKMRGQEMKLSVFNVCHKPDLLQSVTC